MWNRCILYRMLPPVVFRLESLVQIYLFAGEHSPQSSSDPTLAPWRTKRFCRDLFGTPAGSGPTDGAQEGRFAGGRLSATFTSDGFIVAVGRYLHGAFSSTYVSLDFVEEVRVITVTADAEAGRGSGAEGGVPHDQMLEPKAMRRSVSISRLGRGWRRKST